MQVSDLNEVIITDLINNLYNPQLTRSTSSAKRLISPQLALEFPFLPLTQSATRSAQPASGTPSLSRHSRSAQLLALFRLPSLVINNVPGSTWTMRVVSVEREGDSVESGRLAGCHWRAELEWTLECGFKVPLVGVKSVGQKARRIVELEFEETEHSQQAREDQFDVEGELGEAIPSSASSSPAQEHEKHSSWGSIANVHQPQVVLTKVKYSGLEGPSQLAAVPGLGLVTFFVPYLLSIFLSVSYGFLLLFGLDASTRSLAPSAAHRRRLRAREERHRHKKKQHQHRHSIEAKQTSSLARASDRVSSGPPSESSEGSDGLSERYDLSSPGTRYESRYHFAMRSLHGWTLYARNVRNAVKEGSAQTVEEFGAFLWAMRSMVVAMVEAGMSLGGVGVAVLNDGVDDAVNEGRRIGSEVHAAAKAQKLTGPSIVPSAMSSPPKSGSHVKRVSFAGDVDDNGRDGSPVAASSPSRTTVQNFFDPSPHRRTPSTESSLSSSSYRPSHVARTPPRPRVRVPTEPSVEDEVGPLELSSASPVRVPPPTPAEPSAVDHAHKHEMLDELGQRSRSASISMDAGLGLMPSRMTPPSEEVKGHKRQVSHTLHILRQAATQLEQDGDQTQDEQSTASTAHNLQPSKVGAGPTGVSGGLPRRSSVTFDDSPEVIGGGTEVDSGAHEGPARMGLGGRRPSSEHVATPIPSPRRNTLTMSPSIDLQTPPHPVGEDEGQAQPGNEVARATEEQLGDDKSEAQQQPAAEGQSIYEQVFAATAKDLDIPLTDRDADGVDGDDTASQSSSAAAEADEEATPLVPVDPTPLDERPAGPFPAPIVGHTESDGSASGISALEHSSEGAHKEAELGPGTGDGAGTGTGNVSAAVAEGVELSSQAFEGVLKAAGGPATPSVGGVGISSAATEGVGRFELSPLDEAGALLERRKERSASMGEVDREMMVEGAAAGEGVPRYVGSTGVAGCEAPVEDQSEGASEDDTRALGHGRDATWATEVGEEDGGLNEAMGMGGVNAAEAEDDNGSLPDLEEVDPTFSPDLNASTSTKSSTPASSPKRPVVRTSPSQTSLKGKSPAKSTSPTKLSSGGSSTAKAAKAREAQARAAMMEGEVEGSGLGLGSRKEGEGEATRKAGANKPKHGRPKGGKRKGSRA